MSVLIKDMEMPTSCNTCELAALVDISDGIAYGCRALKEMIYNDRERLPNCPLIEVSEDVQPVKHGWWVFNKLPNNWEEMRLSTKIFYVCDICGHIADDISNYCPYCGAKMDAGDEK